MTLTPNGYRPRLIDAHIDNLLRMYGAVSIEGTKYCGKTWTALNHSESVFALDDPSFDYNNLKLAKADVNQAMDGDRPHLIDEWQTVPAIWDGVRRACDGTTAKGQFILCGSSTPPEVVSGDPADTPGSTPFHSGIGRITTVRMRTMSLFESGDSSGTVSLRDMFDSRFKARAGETPDMKRLIRLTVRGGWPGNIGLTFDDDMRGYPGYIDQLCEKDLPRTDRSKSPTRMKMLLRSLARNESTVCSNVTLAKDMKEFEDETIKDSTVANYIDTLNRMFLLENQPAYNPGNRSPIRVGKSPKRHLSDPAIAISALGMSTNDLMRDLNTYGFMFEAMCERDLQIYANADGGKLFHYREGNREVDAVIEMADGSTGAFEIKLGADQIDKGAENLLRFSDRMADSKRVPKVLCVVCGMVPSAYRREDGVYVVPITSLRN